MPGTPLYKSPLLQDSLSMSYDTTTAHNQEAIHQSLLPPFNSTITPQSLVSSSSWSTIALITVLLLATFIKIKFPKTLTKSFGAFFNARLHNQLNKDTNIHSYGYIISAYLLFVVSLSLSLFKILNQFTQIKITQGINGFMNIGGFIIIYTLLYRLTTMLTANLFKTNLQTNILYFNNRLFNIVSGFFLAFTLPIILYTQSQTMILLTLIIFILLMIFKVLQHFFYGLRIHPFSIFYFILYLCTLEIIPVLLLAKWVISNSRA